MGKKGKERGKGKKLGKQPCTHRPGLAQNMWLKLLLAGPIRQGMQELYSPVMA